MCLQMMTWANVLKRRGNFTFNLLSSGGKVPKLLVMRCYLAKLGICQA